MNKLKSKVMLIANKLVKQGTDRSRAMKKAWLLVKQQRIVTRVVGVTFGKRQKAIEHLNRYNKDDITIKLERERENVSDSNAIAVVATVKGKGCYVMGYINKALSSLLAPLMDYGCQVSSIFHSIIGRYQAYMNYGLCLTVRI